MEYYAPLNSGDPDASYVDFDPETLTTGSYPPARGFEAVLRELTHLIAASGQTPSDEDLTQLRQAIVIDADTTYTVNPAGGANFLSVADALEFAGGKMINRGVVVTILLSAGVHEWPAGTTFDHFCGHQIRIAGADLLGSFPVSGDFTGTKATDESMLRGKFATIIECGDYGLEMRSSIGAIENVLLVGSGSGSGIKTNSDDILAYTQVVHCFIENVWAHDFSNGIAALHQTMHAGGPFGASHCASAGLISTYGGIIRGSGLVGKELSGHYCGTAASTVNRGQIYAPGGVFRQSTNQNLRAVQKSYIYASGGVAAAADTCVQALNDSYIHVPNVVATSAATLGFHAASGSFIYAVGATGTGSASPAINTVGNQNSYIQT